MALNDTHVQGLMRAFDTPWPGPRGESISISSGDIALTLFRKDAARITSLKFKGVELLRQHNPSSKAFQYGCFPMIPWVGRMKGGDIHNGDSVIHLYSNKGQNAMHGMAHFEDWKLESYTPSSVVLSYEVGEPWPWPCKVVQTLSIKDNSLFMSLEISTDSGEFPVDAGWHPWFLKDPDGVGEEQLKVEFAADNMEEIGDDEIPTGRKLPVNNGPWDDCFNFSNFKAGATLTYPGVRRIRISSNCPALIVFNKQPDATCVNTMTGVPNGVNTCPHMISPITKLRAEAVWSFESLQ